MQGETIEPSVSVPIANGTQPAATAAALPALEPGKVQVRALYSGVSRGTERLILNGLVPANEHARIVELQACYNKRNS